MTSVSVTCALTHRGGGVQSRRVTAQVLTHRWYYRRNTEAAVEMAVEVTLVREARSRRDVRQCVAGFQKPPSRAHTVAR